MKAQMLRFTLSLSMLLTFPLKSTAQVVDIPDPVPPSPAIRDAFELDPFYQQWIDVEGLPIVASAQVNPYAVKEAAWLLHQMIGHRRDLLQAIVQSGGRFIVIGYTELTTDIPEYSHKRPAFYWDRRARGLGGIAVSCTEENLLDYPGDTAPTGYQLIHEFSHTVHHIGLEIVDPTFDNRLKVAYDAAMAKGLWHGTYSATNRSEYWAQGASWYFLNGNQRQDDKINTREELKSYDPALAALLIEIYGDSWRYTPPAVRLHLPHLQGFNPEDSPTFEWPEDLENAFAELNDPDIEGSDEWEWVNLALYHPNQLSYLNSSRTRGNQTEVLFVNRTEVDTLVYRVHRDGRETFIKRIPAKRRYPEFFGARAGDIFLIADQNGEAIAVFRAVEQIGRALVAPELNLITPGLSKVSGDNQVGVSGASLPKPLVIEVRAENLSPLEGISIMFAVTAGDGTLSVTHATTDTNGQAESRLTLGTNLGTNTVSVSALGVGQSVVFNAVAEAVVNIPDPNLRAAIETALGKRDGDPITPSEMATLPELNARDASISNLTGIEFGTNLTTLRLHNNHITDISALSGLTNLNGLYLDNNNIADISALSGLIHLRALGLGGNRISDISALSSLIQLKRLRLGRNSVSDISALSSLTQLTELSLDRNNISDLSPLVANTGLGAGDTVDVRGNPLSELSMKTHIPALQRRGVEVKFDDLTHLNLGDPRTVRLIYFLPNGRPYRTDVVQQMKDEILKVQTFYAEQMEQHGFGWKTFTFETDATGQAMVHRVDGQFTDSYYYQDTSDKVRQELAERFYTQTRIYIVVIDTGLERIGVRDRQVCGDASEGRFFMPGSGPCFSFYVIAHELGHTFGLRHDFRSNAYMLSYGITNIRGWNRDRISQCAAEWLDVHSFFNASQFLFNNPTTIRMLPPLASPKAIRLRFEVTDPDGLHQAQLIIPTTAEDPAKGEKLHGCKRLRGESNTIEFITTELTEKSTTEVALHVIDVHGNITRQRYSIQLEEVAADPNAFDVNGDGNINVLDLISIASDSGNTGANLATDVNGDGVVNILDLVLVAEMFEDTLPSPSTEP